MKVFHPAKGITIAIDSINVNNDLTSREREQQAVESLLQSLLGNEILTHNDVGKPEIDGYNISISHTLNRHGGFVALILSDIYDVGIDIEYRSNRIMKIAERFLRNDEHPSTVDEHLVYWCAKEAIYKLFSSEDLTYNQMRVNSAMTSVENLSRDITTPIHFKITDGFIIVWAASDKG